MFLSLVRPEGIWSPMTESAAVTSPCPEEFVPVMMGLMPSWKAIPYPAIGGDVASSRWWAETHRNAEIRNGPGDPLCSAAEACVGQLPADSIRRRSCVLLFAAPAWRSEGLRWLRLQR